MYEELLLPWTKQLVLFLFIFTPRVALLLANGPVDGLCDIFHFIIFIRYLKEEDLVYSLRWTRQPMPASVDDFWPEALLTRQLVSPASRARSMSGYLKQTSLESPQTAALHSRLMPSHPTTPLTSREKLIILNCDFPILSFPVLFMLPPSQIPTRPFPGHPFTAV